MLIPVASKGKASKGSKAAPSDPLLSGSNVYSVPESLLLKWLSYHVNNTISPSALQR